MVTIELFYQDKNLMAYDLTGHAQCRAKGQQFDLVCAAVSVLALAITNGITEVVKLQPAELLVQDGHLRCVLPKELQENQKMQADALLQTLVLGLECLANDYTKHIRIVRRRWPRD